MDTDLLLIFSFVFLTTLVIVVSVGAVILLRPITRHLGDYLQAKAEEGRILEGRNPEEWNRLLETLDTLVGRLDAVEERQEFTEKLLGRPTED